MSKKDPAYDQIDIDNGGGGICMQFTMEIALQLYRSGYDGLATDLLHRVRWIGSRLPYLGDSVSANMLMAREDTPLQADISSVSCTQAILFGVCGIRFSVFVNEDKFEVVQACNGRERHFGGIIGKDKIVLDRFL